MNTDEHRDSAHRGRRQSDQILEGWTWGRVTKIATALTLVGGIVVAVVSVAASLLVTQPQLQAVADTGAAIRRDVRRVERRQDDAENIQRLLPASFRVQCLQLERDRSMSMAEIAGFPCDSLLRRVR